MTQKERDNPAILNASRKKRIAAGSGTSVVEINRLLKGFDAMNAMVKQMSGTKKGRRMAKKAGMLGL
jgi:signal recognition particle subunit SRP54